MNGSSLHNETNLYDVRFSVEEKIGFSAAYLAILLVAVIGNSFVIHVARKLLSAGRGPFYILVINMAASDILYALAVVSLQVKYCFVEHLWFPGGFGTFLCKFSSFALLFAISSSILTLTAMTVDRYLAIVPDIKKPLTRKNVLKVLVVILVLSFAYSLIQLFVMKTVSRSYSGTKLTFCYAVYSRDKDVNKKLFKAQNTAFFTLFFLFPVALMSVLYFYIIRVLWVRKIPGNNTDQNKAQKRRQLRKVTCMLVTMATTFAVSWLPVHAYNYYWFNYNGSTLPSFLVLLFYWSGHTNCATNPCFYLLFNKEYQDELRHIVQRCSCKSSQDEIRAREINLYGGET